MIELLRNIEEKLPDKNEKSISDDEDSDDSYSKQ